MYLGAPLDFILLFEVMPDNPNPNRRIMRQISRDDHIMARASSAGKNGGRCFDFYSSCQDRIPRQQHPPDGTGGGVT